MKLMKKLPLVVTVLLSSVAFAYNNGCEPAPACPPKPCECKCVEPMKPYDQGYPICEDQMVGAYNSPARIDVRACWDLYVTGSFLYYQVKETGLELGYKKHTTALEDVSNQKANLIKMDADYKPGFKVGLGMEFDHDNWDAYAEYTRLQFEHSKSVTANREEGQSISSLWDSLLGFVQAPEGRYDKISAKWEPSLNMVDLSLGRAYYVGTELTFRPYAGIRWGLLDQEYRQKTHVIGTDETAMLRIHLDSDSWFVGPRMGVDTNWLFCGGFRFFANTAASLLYQHFDVSYRFPAILGTASGKVNDGDDSLTTITPNLMVTMGLAWGTYFDHNNWNFDLSAGYAFEVFFNQNSMKYLRDSFILSSGAEAGKLFMHGLVVTARLDF